MKVSVAERITVTVVLYIEKNRFQISFIIENILVAAPFFAEVL